MTMTTTMMMSYKAKTQILAWAIVLGAFAGLGAPLWAATKVGNGDEGSDLEGVAQVRDGHLIESRDKALAHLQRIGVEGISGLGNLIPELKSSTIYLAGKDVNGIVASDQGQFHADFQGKVYARTFAEPHAATRFFPVALPLSQDQLVALHIHEALHRALPPSIREDEPCVTELTLAITSPEASRDRVQAKVEKLLPMAPMPSNQELEPEHFPNPSSVGYRIRQFREPTHPSTYPVTRMHSLYSNLYPFGGINTPVGLGIESSFIQGNGFSQAGPLLLSARVRLWSRRDFSIGTFATAALNVLSAEELKNSPFGRDVYSVGLSMKKELKSFYVENFLSYDFGGQSRQKVGLINYTYNYGGIVDARIRAGYRIWKFDLGGYGEMHLADLFRVAGGAFAGDFGRHRIISAGPEVSFVEEGFALTLSGRFLVDSTRGASFDVLGNIMGPGVSQGSISASANIFF